MFISIITSLALILQIGAFAVHVHPNTHVYAGISLEKIQAEKGQHCDLCDCIPQIASNSTIGITFVNTCSLLPHVEDTSLLPSYFFSERASSRAPPSV